MEASARQIPTNGNPAFEPLLIINSFFGKQFLGSLFSSHPPTDARIEALLKLEHQQPTTVYKKNTVCVKLSHFSAEI